MSLRFSIAAPVFSIVIPCVMVLLILPYILTPLYRFINPPSTLMMWQALNAKPVFVHWISIDRLPRAVIQSVIAAEDGRFCEHHGIDFTAIRRVLAPLKEGEIPKRGASTIPMQLAKNLYLWHGKSLMRKILEAPLALWIDALWPKKRVLEVYLNIAEWGDGIFGIEAAARHYFGISAAKLNPWQARLLVASLPNPLVRNPAKPPEYLSKIANDLARREAHQGAITYCVR